MTVAETSLTKVMTSVYERSKAFLRDEMDIRVTGVEPGAGNFDALALREITVIIGMTGPINLLVSFSFGKDIMEALFTRFTADIEVPRDERDLYVTETASEIVNTVLGHCTSDLAEAGETITLTPPIVVDHGKTIRRHNRAKFACIALSTDCGVLDISFVGSREMFDEELFARRR